MKKFILFFVILLCLFSINGCKKNYGTNTKFKAYLYKQPLKDGLVCVFYSNYKFIAEQNAQMFADMHLEKYGVPLIVRTVPY